MTILNDISLKKWYMLPVLLMIFCVLIATLISFFNFRSLWLDEALLSINFQERTFTELLSPLEYHQVAPIGFLWLEKISFTIFEGQDWSLRILPLICYFLSILIFYALNKKIFRSTLFAFLGCTLFCVNFNLYTYSIEIKQYMMDVLISISLTYLFLNYRDTRTSKSILLFAICGFVSVWMSNIAIIILFVFSIIMLIDKKLDSFSDRATYLPIYSFIISFSIYFLIFILGHPAKTYMYEYWTSQRAFIPLNFFNSAFYISLYQKIDMLINTALTFKFAGLIGVLLIAIGVLANLKKHFVLGILILPVITHLILSYLQIYPFAMRLILYLIPFIIVLFLMGFKSILKSSPLKYRNWIFLSFFLLIATGFAKIIINTPQQKSELKENLAFINKMSNKSDNLYIYLFANPTFRFYEPQFSELQFKKITRGEYARNNRAKFEKEILQIKSKTWFLFAHSEKIIDGMSDEEFFLSLMNQHGYTILDSQQTYRSSVYLVSR